MKIISILKAKLRDWAFADYKWITRSQVQREICLIQWKYKDHPLIVKTLHELKETLK
jgi:hypothetical protein